jgi:hypothetical protein
VLSGYTVAIVAIQEIDAPQQLDQADVNWDAPGCAAR